MAYCENCSFFSESHAACFHPDAWHDTPMWPTGFGFKAPGDPGVLNRDGMCPWYDETPPLEPPVQSNGIAGKLKRFFRPWRIRITK